MGLGFRVAPSFSSPTREPWPPASHPVPGSRLLPPTMRSTDANMAAPAEPPPLTDFKLGLRRRQLLLGDEAPSPSQERRGTERTKPTSTDELVADQLGVPTRPPPSASTDKMEVATSAGAEPRGTAANQNAPTRGPANDTRAAACCWGGPGDGGRWLLPRV